MKLPHSGQHSRKKWERILAWSYLCLFVLFFTLLVLRTIGVLPGGAPEWHVWALTLVALGALLSFFLSLPQSVNRVLNCVLWILIAIILVLRLAT